MMLGVGAGLDFGDITSSGLVLYLDAGNSNSYSGSGYAWYDLTNKNNDATLRNEYGVDHSPSYSSTSGGGSFSFNGSDEHARIPDSTDFIFPVGSPSTSVGEFTQEAWFKRSSSSGEEIVLERGDSTTSNASWCGLRMTMNYDGDKIIARQLHHSEPTGQYEYSAGQYSTVFEIPSGWVHMVVTKYSHNAIKLFLNGDPKVWSVRWGGQGWQSRGTSVSSDYDINIAGGDSSTRFTGEIAILRVYKNKALSDSEVLAHYNAEKTRFGHS